MSSTPKPHRTVSRINRAYIQVPSSPLTLSHSLALSIASTTPAHVPSSKLKENTPMRPSLLVMSHASSSTSLKRKLSDREGPTQVLEGVIITSKKSKLSIHTSSTGLKSGPEILAKSNNAEHTSNEFVYCHQCNKKRDAAETIRCTVIERHQAPKSKTIKERMCAYKYCKHCLKNRYDEDIDKLKAQLSERNGTACGFQCPRCRDICNCPRCRKSKGLEAIGFISKDKSKPSNSTTNASKAKAQSLLEAKAREITTAKLKALPAINWTSLSIDLTQGEAEERMFIREFVLRFGDFLDPVVAKSHIEELELIGGRLHKNGDHIGATWVSDMCVRALIISILGVLARDYDVLVSKIIKSAVKEVKSAGTNLSKIWTVLAQLRDGFAHISTSEPNGSGSQDREAQLTFPDPSPPPVSAANARRSLRQADVPTILCSTQMIPILVSLIHSALETTIIREEIDRGTKDARDFGRDARDATRIENERWEKERNTMELATKDKALKIENRNKRAGHKLQVTNIENSLKIIGPSFSPRFSPLGTDNEGRLYYAISPGMAERESALEYLELAASERLLKPKKKCPLPSADDRMEMREWSWFVAVWGKNPASSGTSSAHRLNTNNSDSEDEYDAEKWWGFWDPDEIARLAQWISIKAGVDDDDQSASGEPGSISHKEKVALPPRLAQYKRLAVELKDYANLLRWRIRDDKCTLINGPPGNYQRR